MKLEKTCFEVHSRLSETSLREPLMFDPGHCVAALSLVDAETGLAHFCDVVATGDVLVAYKGECYRRWSDFPDELKALVEENAGEVPRCGDDGLRVLRKNGFGVRVDSGEWDELAYIPAKDAESLEEWMFSLAEERVVR